MDFKEALQNALQQDRHTHSDPFLLHSYMSDMVGGDYKAKAATEQFFCLNTEYGITQTILCSAPKPEPKPKKKRVYHVKPRPKPKKRVYRVKPLPKPEKRIYHIKAMPIPYRKARVFYEPSTDTVHLLKECPKLNYTKDVQRVSYKKAQRLSAHSAHPEISWFSSRLKRLAKEHTPKICRRCGDFLCG